MVESDLYGRAVEKFGVENQIAVTIGEFAECSAEMARTFIVNREVNNEAMLLELADAYIMIRQMEYIYGEDLVKAVHKKLKKVRQHVES